MPLRHLDLTSLALFRAICRHGSITHGAQEFGLALGAASRRVSELERRLGCVLLLRGKSGVLPTAAGATLLEHSEKLAGEADRLDLAFEDHRLGIDTRLRIWANTSAVNGFLPEKMMMFSRLHPSVRIDLEEEFSDAVVRAVTDGRAEIGVFAASESAWSLHSAVCDTHRLVGIAPAEHPLVRRKGVKFADMLDFDFVGLTRGTALQNQLTVEAQRLNRPLRLRMQVRSYDAVCKIVSVGMGISLVPEQVAALLAEPLDLAVFGLEDPWTVRNLIAAVRSPDELSAAAREFFAMLTAPRLDPFDGKLTTGFEFDTAGKLAA